MTAEPSQTEPVEQPLARRAAFAVLGTLLLAPLLAACKTGSTAPGSGVETIKKMREQHHDGGPGGR